MLASFEDLRENMLDYFSYVKNLEEITEDAYEDAVIEVCDNMVDIYTYDLLKSVEELYQVGAFDEVDMSESQDIIGLISLAQYRYYYETLQEAYSYDSMIEDLKEEK